MNRILVVVTLLLTLSAPLFAAGASESAASATRGRYLAGQGIIVPPEEVLVDNYIAQINYNYPAKLITRPPGNSCPAHTGHTNYPALLDKSTNQPNINISS